MLEYKIEDYKKLQQSISKVASLLYNKNILSGCDGNLSCRVPEKNLVLITASGRHKAFLKTESSKNFSLINASNATVLSGGAPSSEKSMHLKVYNCLASVNAVIHAHPPYATALSIAYPHLTYIPGEYLSELIPVIGRVPILNYQTPGTKDMSKDFEKNFTNTKAFILAHHGAITWGKTLEEAFGFMECLEHNAKIIFLSLSSKEAKSLEPSEVSALWGLHKKIYND